MRIHDEAVQIGDFTDGQAEEAGGSVIDAEIDEVLHIVEHHDSVE